MKYLTLFFFLWGTFFLEAKEFYFVADNSAFYVDSFSKIEDRQDPTGVWDKIKWFLEKKGHKVFAINKNKLLKFTPGHGQEVVIINSIKDVYINNIPKKRMSLMVFEPPSVDLKLHKTSFRKKFHKIFSWEENKNFITFRLPVFGPIQKDFVEFSKRKLVTLMSRNIHSNYKAELYSERRRAISYFNHFPDQFDLWGKGWNKDSLQVYRGLALDKILTLEKYKFSICYENTSDKKCYITEKIFDCFQAGVVPIYLGAPNIEKIIPRNCFIDKRKFKTYEALHEFLSNMSEDEFNSYLQNIKEFMSGEAAREFSQDAFVEKIVSGLLSEN